MQFMNVIDSIILSFFTIISHKFQRLTGRTNFFLAKICLIIAGASVLVRMLNYFVPLLGTPSHPISVIIRLYLLYGISNDMKKCDLSEEDFLSGKPVKRFGISGELWWRMLFLVAVMLDLNVTYLILFMNNGIMFFKVIDGLFGPIYLSWLYFIAVIPMPPGKSKATEWAENIAAAFKKLAPSKVSS